MHDCIKPCACLLELIVELASSQFTGSESAGSIDVVITKSSVLSNTIINAEITLTPISAIGAYINTVIYSVLSYQSFVIFINPLQCPPACVFNNYPMHNVTNDVSN